MSDGGRERGRNQQTTSKKSRLSSRGDEFSHAVTKIAVGQICESVGFHGSNRTAINAMADIMVRYICDLGKSANFYANLAGRTSCNVFDIIQGLEDLSSSRGFSGASDVHRCLVGSGVVREITQFVTTEEVPFAQPISRYPVRRTPKPTPSFAQVGETSSGTHIPDWVPRFPDPRTYVRMEEWNKGATDTKIDKVIETRQQMKAESSLLSLQQRLACNSTTGFQPNNDASYGKERQMVVSNPYLSPPLPFGEKEVSVIANPWKRDADAGNGLYVLETSVPATESGKVGPVDFETNEKKVLPGSRPIVHFKLKVDKKSITASFSSDALDAKNDSWPLRHDGKDDKKRRAEIILKEAMEKPHDLAQL
ncbi:hypothetical protein OPV22_031751 [Ensete ventricosum]|uniref:Transcription initiation factor TFIID subunit 8 n=1 Tax=Ensete ventricosum TaxID=4639 RepID=A0A427AIC2_ENSVE|nr:hypothetical protein OPV22_031751 [Ensete ventricosum]RRT76013.1 hypothetical protein B296_00000723 [Ensete ventricosum]RWW08995.1 hypothetical protein GW17_00027541 [Ensete ventricosum]RWW81925.1 hypothetical protein BHE74_00009636 [Ensete ventricosum]RZR76575.1 hypothetical protein BHM03_00001401 [Ensete ventricosum]